ncbi:MAG TPA: BON domain-containing protein [Paraburkholderia sp.]|jgi:hyperosmotically inducible protein|nr:BON domain-containing protein [Paraburkholderia sp.]
MKSAVLKVLGGVVAVMVACNVYAQASDTGADAQAPAATSAKAQKKANGQLGRKVRAALAKAKGLDVSSIAVRARSGAVTLTGTVPDQQQIDLAGDTAKGVAGVSSVTNKLNVQQQ